MNRHRFSNWIISLKIQVSKSLKGKILGLWVLFFISYLHILIFQKILFSQLKKERLFSWGVHFKKHFKKMKNGIFSVNSRYLFKRVALHLYEFKISVSLLRKIFSRPITPIKKTAPRNFENSKKEQKTKLSIAKKIKRIKKCVVLSNSKFNK